MLSTVTVGGCWKAGAPLHVLSTVTVVSKSPLASTRHVLSTATVTEYSKRSYKEMADPRIFLAFRLNPAAQLFY